MIQQEIVHRDSSLAWLQFSQNAESCVSSFPWNSSINLSALLEVPGGCFASRILLIITWSLKIQLGSSCSFWTVRHILGAGCPPEWGHPDGPFQEEAITYLKSCLSKGFGCHSCTLSYVQSRHFHSWRISTIYLQREALRLVPDIAERKVPSLWNKMQTFQRSANSWVGFPSPCFFLRMHCPGITNLNL